MGLIGGRKSEEKAETPQEYNDRMVAEVEATWRERIKALTIWKFPIEITDEQTIRIPQGARILGVAEQVAIRDLYEDGKLVLWAMVDPRNEWTERKIWIAGTGRSLEHILERQGTHLATVPMRNGLVWHVFEPAQFMGTAHRSWVG